MRPGPDDLAVIAPSLPRRLGRAFVAYGPPAAPEHARSRLLEAAVDAVEHAGADRPLVLLLDDAHLADTPSLELLAYVLRRFTGLGVLAILTCRTTPQRPDLDALLRAHVGRGGELLELDVLPLPRGDVERLVATVAELPPEQRAQVIAAADGNPLLAIEGARAAGAGRDGPPESLQAVVRAAVGRLPDGARRAAELAAVAGRDLTLTEVGALASQEDVLRALDCGLLTAEHGDFGYRHALLRDAALADMPEPRRRGLHEELAGALRGPAAETARHLRLAGRDDLAAGRLARAARDAAAVGAVDEAAEFLREALELRPATPRSRSSSRPRRPTAAAGSPPRTRCGRRSSCWRRPSTPSAAPSTHGLRAGTAARCAGPRRRCRRRGARSPSSTGRTASIPPSSPAPWRSAPGARRSPDACRMRRAACAARDP